MRPEIVAAVRESAGSPGRLPDADCERVARAVLKAALTGEPTGPHTVRWIAPQRAHPMFHGDTATPALFEIVGPTEMAQLFRRNSDARAVANALNLGRDLVSEANVTSNASIAAGGTDGE